MHNTSVSSAGRLFYVIGASGAGKDSVMREAAARLSDHPVVFAPRYITRRYAPEGENHVPVSETTFEHLKAGGCLLMYWQAHGLHYGIGREVQCWLDSGVDVVVNGSRAYLAQADHDWPGLIPVHVHVEPDNLARRLRARGRETEAEIAERLQRAKFFDSVQHPKLVSIDNNGELARSGHAFAELLRT